MAKYQVKIKCLASYIAEVEAEPGDNLEERVLEQMPDFDVSHLEFYDDIDRNFIIDIKACS